MQFGTLRGPLSRRLRNATALELTTDFVFTGAYTRRNDLLITHPVEPFYLQVSGQSMVEAGIGDGDLLVVNRAITPVHRHIVVTQVDGDLTVKYLYKRSGRIKFTTANPTFPEITFSEGQQLIICGVVSAAIKRFAK